VRGKNNGVPVQADVPQGWQVLRYGDREQPWTLSFRLSYQNDRHQGWGRSAQVIRFCGTLAEAEARSKQTL